MTDHENDSVTAAQRAAQGAQTQTSARLSLVARHLRQAAYDKHRETVLELSKIRATVAAEDNPYEVLVPIQVRDAYVVADILDRVPRRPSATSRQTVIVADQNLVAELAVAIARIEELDLELAEEVSERRGHQVREDLREQEIAELQRKLDAAQRANEELVRHLKQRATDGHRGLDEALNSGDGSYRP